MVTCRLVSAAAIAAAWLVATGCTDPEIEGKYLCATPGDCPDDWACGCRAGDTEQRCYSSGSGFGACGVPAPPPPVTPVPPVVPAPIDSGPPACDYVGQTGCPGQVCYLTEDRRSSRCADAGPTAFLEDCSGDSDCMPGMVCQRYSPGSGRCYRTCEQSAECSPGICVDLDPGSNPPLPRGGFCSIDCVVDASCGSDGTCRMHYLGVEAVLYKLCE